VTSTFATPVGYGRAANIGYGRHRAGRPGLVAVTAFVKVARRSLFTSWFRPGKHRQPTVVPQRPGALVPAARAA